MKPLFELESPEMQSISRALCANCGHEHYAEHGGWYARHCPECPSYIRFADVCTCKRFKQVRPLKVTDSYLVPFLRDEGEAIAGEGTFITETEGAWYVYLNDGRRFRTCLRLPKHPSDKLSYELFDRKELEERGT